MKCPGDGRRLTRRNYLAGGSSLIGSTFLAGCPESGTESTTADTTTATSDGTHTATLSPVAG